MNECWRVVVRHERRSGSLGFFKSEPMSFTAARKLLDRYHRSGHRAYLEEDADLVEQHLRSIASRKQRDAELAADLVRLRENG